MNKYQKELIIMKKQISLIAFFLFVTTSFLFISNVSFASSDNIDATVAKKTPAYFDLESRGPVFIIDVDSFHDSHEIWRPSLPVLKFT